MLSSSDDDGGGRLCQDTAALRRLRAVIPCYRFPALGHFNLGCRHLRADLPATLTVIILASCCAQSDTWQIFRMYSGPALLKRFIVDMIYSDSALSKFNDYTLRRKGVPGTLPVGIAWVLRADAPSPSQIHFQHSTGVRFLPFTTCVWKDLIKLMQIIIPAEKPKWFPVRDAGH
jgi:hypothetical protein